MPTNEEIKGRFVALGGEGSQQYIAEAMGISKSGLSQRFNRGTINIEMLCIVELLEAIPIDQWPARWRSFKQKALLTSLAKLVDD